MIMLRVQLRLSRPSRLRLELFLKAEKCGKTPTRKEKVEKLERKFLRRGFFPRPSQVLFAQFQGKPWRANEKKIARESKDFNSIYAIKFFVRLAFKYANNTFPRTAD